MCGCIMCNFSYSYSLLLYSTVWNIYITLYVKHWKKQKLHDQKFSSIIRIISFHSSIMEETPICTTWFCYQWTDLDSFQNFFITPLKSSHWKLCNQTFLVERWHQCFHAILEMPSETAVAQRNHFFLLYQHDSSDHNRCLYVCL